MQPQIQAAINKFNNNIQILSNPRTEEDYRRSNSLLIYIRNLIQQRNIVNIEPEEIFTESYIRAQEYIKRNGKEVINTVPFLKKIALNCVREIHRKQKKELLCDPTIFENLISTTTTTSSESFLENLSKEEQDNVKSKLNKLSPLDKQIIQLWQVERWKWKNIVDELKKQGENLSLVNARKKGERIMKKLKQ